MAGIQLRMNVEEARQWLADGGEEFRQGSSRLKVATQRAINRTLEHMRSLISMEIRDRYYAQKEDVDAALEVREARSGKNQLGALLYRDDASLPLSAFGAAQRTTFVSVRVLKAHRTRRIQPGGKWGILATAKGRAAVWMARDQVWARVAGQDHPRMLFGPSFMSFFGLPNVEKALGIEMDGYFARRLAHEARVWPLLESALRVNFLSRERRS